MTRRAVLRANAKINLTLGILGRREDGYHELESVMQSVDLCDTVSIALTEAPGAALRCSEPSLAGRGNLALRAAELFFARTGAPGGCGIALEKRIPAAAGLAGGSADAAAVLAGLNRLCGAPLSASALACLGLELGADVPFCLSGGTRLARGVGERLSPAPPLPLCRLLLCRRGLKSSTGALYAAYDASPALRQPDTDAMLRALAGGLLPDVARGLCNVFEGSVPGCGELKRRLLEAGALGAALSGSGPTVFGLFAPGEASAEAASGFADVSPQWCAPCARGVTFVFREE